MYTSFDNAYFLCWCITLSKHHQGFISLTIFHRTGNSYLRENSFCSHPSWSEVIATKFCGWHDSCTVVPCAKFGSDTVAYNGVAVKLNFHRMWITMDNFLMKWVPVNDIYDYRIRIGFGMIKEKVTIQYIITLRGCDEPPSNKETNGLLTSLLIRGYPAKRALSALRKHGGWGPFGRIPSLYSVFNGCIAICVLGYSSICNHPV